MRTAAINIRAREDERSLIDYASQITGKTRSDFMLEAACEKAQQALLDRVFFNLNEQDFAQFTQALEESTSIEASTGLARLMAVKAPWETQKTA